MLCQFGQLINEKFTVDVLWLYRHENSKYFRCTTQCGINHFRKFTEKYFGGNLNPLPNKCMSLKGLLLFSCWCSFSWPNKPKYTTFWNYIGHIRSLGEQSGATLLPFDRAGLIRVLRGISCIRPSNHDRRQAFLLPISISPIFFRTCYNRVAPLKGCHYTHLFWHVKILHLWQTYN